MRRAGSTLVLVAAILAVVAAASWVAGDEQRGPEFEAAPTPVSDLESRLGLLAEDGGDLGRPRSLHAALAERAEPAETVARRTEPGRRSRSLATPAGAHRLLKVRAGGRVPIRLGPGGAVAGWAGQSTEFGSPTVLGVVRSSGPWVEVTTPALPNHRFGWIHTGRGDVELGWTARSVHVSLSRRRVTLRHDGRALRSFRITVGAPGTRTPTGRFAVTDTFRGGLNPVYGCCAVALSATQPDLPPGWPGGNRIAIHGNGTGQPLGGATSNGCLRAEDADVDALVDQVDLGTPVFISE